MSINLQKGAKVDLTKTNPGVAQFLIGLGWNPATTGKPFDIDASAFVLGDNGKRVSDAHFVFYNNLVSPSGLVVHNGDNLTGEGEGDDETLVVNFSKATPEEKQVLIIVTIHNAAANQQNFGQISGAYIRVVNKDTNEELYKYDLQEDFSIETAVIFGKLYLKDGEWKFSAEGIGNKDGLDHYVNLY